MNSKTSWLVLSSTTVAFIVSYATNASVGGRVLPIEEGRLVSISIEGSNRTVRQWNIGTIIIINFST